MRVNETNATFLDVNILEGLSFLRKTPSICLAREEELNITNQVHLAIWFLSYELDVLD